MNSSTGFTLVEVLVTGLLASILAGAIISSLYMTNLQTKEGIGTERLIQISVAATEEIRRKVRRATTLVQYLPPSHSGIILLDSAGLAIGGFTYQSAILQELIPGTGWRPMMIGNDTVRVFNDTALSNFFVSPTGIGLSFRLRFQLSEFGKTFYFPAIQDQVQCRGNL